MNSQSNYADGFSAALFGFFGWMLDMLQLLLVGIFLLSTWLTRLLFEWLLVPLFPALERHDGLVIVVSSTIWAGVAGLVIFPYLVLADFWPMTPEQVAYNWGLSLAAGAVWGMLCAAWVLVLYWEEIISRQAAPAFTKVLALDPEFYQADKDEQPEMQTLEQLEAEFLRTMQMDGAGKLQAAK